MTTTTAFGLQPKRLYRNVSTTTDTPTAADVAFALRCTHASGCAVTLDATGFAEGDWFDVVAEVAPVTIASSNTIIGGGSLIIPKGCAASFMLRSTTWTAVGGFAPRVITSISGNTSAGAAAGTDYVYLCSTSPTLTLPTAVGNSNRYTVKNSGSGTVSVATTSSQTIDGGAAPITLAAGQSLDFYSDGSNWWIG